MGFDPITLTMCKKEIADEISKIETTQPTTEPTVLDGTVAMHLLIMLMEAAQGTGSAFKIVGATEGATLFQDFI